MRTSATGSSESIPSVTQAATHLDISDFAPGDDLIGVLRRRGSVDSNVGVASLLSVRFIMCMWELGEHT